MFAAEKGWRFATVERFQNALGVAAVISLLGCGCVHIRPPIHKDLSARLAEIRSVAVSPPRVSGYLEIYDNLSTRTVPLSASATSNLLVAVQQHFSTQRAFVIRNIDLNQSSLSPMVPFWGAAGDCGPMLNTNFQPLAFSMSADEPLADAVLFTFAFERTSTAGAIIKKNAVGGMFMFPFFLMADVFYDRPDSGLKNYVSRIMLGLGICLIDCRTGEVLWSDIQTRYGNSDFSTPGVATELVGKSYRKLESYLR